MCNQGFMDMAFGIEDIFVNKDWHVIKKDIPMFLQYGNLDVISAYPNSIKKIAPLLIKAGYQNIDSKVYLYARNDLLWNTNRDEVIRDIIIWLNQTVNEGID